MVSGAGSSKWTLTPVEPVGDMAKDEFSGWFSLRLNGKYLRDHSGAVAFSVCTETPMPMEYILSSRF